MGIFGKIITPDQYATSLAAYVEHYLIDGEGPSRGVLKAYLGPLQDGDRGIIERELVLLMMAIVRYYWIDMDTAVFRKRKELIESIRRSFYDKMKSHRPDIADEVDTSYAHYYLLLRELFSADDYNRDKERAITATQQIFARFCNRVTAAGGKELLSDNVCDEEALNAVAELTINFKRMKLDERYNYSQVRQ